MTEALWAIIDTHPGVNEETLLSIAISDLLLLVMRPDNQDFQGTAVTAELARRLEVKQMLLLVNKVPPSMDRDGRSASPSPCCGSCGSTDPSAHPGVNTSP